MRCNSQFAQRAAEEEAHAASTLHLWKRLSLFVCIPVVSYLTWKKLYVEREHLEKFEYHPWSHLRIRNKPFPWGDGDLSLLHNPKTNPVPPKEESTEEAEEEERVHPLTQFIADYMMEDRDKRDQLRWDHLAYMQRRKEEYLARQKRIRGEHRPPPLFPHDFIAEIRQRRSEPRVSGIDY